MCVKYITVIIFSYLKMKLTCSFMPLDGEVQNGISQSTFALNLSLCSWALPFYFNSILLQSIMLIAQHKPDIFLSLTFSKTAGHFGTEFNEHNEQISGKDLSHCSESWVETRGVTYFITLQCYNYLLAVIKKAATTFFQSKKSTWQKFYI